jgi:hypothetical protein
MGRMEDDLTISINDDLLETRVVLSTKTDSRCGVWLWNCVTAEEIKSKELLTLVRVIIQGARLVK